jgi:hypothetical protein
MQSRPQILLNFVLLLPPETRGSQTSQVHIPLLSPVQHPPASPVVTAQKKRSSPSNTNRESRGREKQDEPTNLSRPPPRRRSPSLRPLRDERPPGAEFSWRAPSRAPIWSPHAELRRSAHTTPPGQPLEPRTRVIQRRRGRPAAGAPRGRRRSILLTLDGRDVLARACREPRAGLPPARRGGKARGAGGGGGGRGGGRRRGAGGARAPPACALLLGAGWLACS